VSITTNAEKEDCKFSPGDLGAVLLFPPPPSSHPMLGLLILSGCKMQGVL